MAWPAHNLGRVIDAFQRLEASGIGFDLPSEIRTALIENLKDFCDNEESLCINPDPEDWFELHSLRETYLALTAMVKWGEEAWALQKAAGLATTINRLLKPDFTWDLDRSAVRRSRTSIIHRHFDPVGSHGRMLEGLAEFYAATNWSGAVDLAEKLGRYHFRSSLSPDGSLNRDSQPDHTHSYLGLLKGVFRWGLWLDHPEWCQAVRATYQQTVRRLVKPSGFVSHDLEADHGPEPASTADAVQLALWLVEQGDETGLDDAERWIRSRLIPSIIHASPELTGSPDMPAGADEVRNLNNRIVGAFGGCHSKPHGGKQSVTDVSAACVHSLLDVRNRIIWSEGDRRDVLLHLDYNHPDLTVRHERDIEAVTTLVCKQPARIKLRIPAWVPPDGVVVTVNNEAAEAEKEGCFAVFENCQPGDKITLTHPLPEHETLEPSAGTEFRLKWKGDAVTGITPNTDFYPFYPTLEG